MPKECGSLTEQFRGKHRKAQVINLLSRLMCIVRERREIYGLALGAEKDRIKVHSMCLCLTSLAHSYTRSQLSVYQSDTCSGSANSLWGKAPVPKDSDHLAHRTPAKRYAQHTFTQIVY